MKMQEELEKGKFILNEDGEKKEYTTVFTFWNKDSNKNYVVYTDETKDENDNINLYASSYNPNDTEFNLYEVSNEEEWGKIKQTLNNLISDGE